MKFSISRVRIFSPIILVVVFVLITIISCLGYENKQVVQIGAQSPKISGNDINGEYISPGQLKGKVVVVYFWKLTSDEERIKKLEMFYRNNELNGLEVVAVNGADSRTDVESYAKDNSLSFIMLNDSHSKLVNLFKVTTVPSVFILDRKGIIREMIQGDISPAKIKLVTQRLLQGS